MFPDPAMKRREERICRIASRYFEALNDTDDKEDRQQFEPETKLDRWVTEQLGEIEEARRYDNVSSFSPLEFAARYSRAPIEEEEEAVFAPTTKLGHWAAKQLKEMEEDDVYSLSPLEVSGRAAIEEEDNIEHWVAKRLKETEDKMKEAAYKEANFFLK